jgi:2'-5' RNA ligase
MAVGYFNIMKMIVSKLNGDYDKSSLQVQIPDDLAKEIVAWGNDNIPEKIMHNDGEDTKGREDDIHVTLFYGLNTPDYKDVKDLLKDVKPFKIRLGLINGFQDKDDYDVLKIDVESPDLIQLHYKIRGSDLDFDNKFPTYNPHCTIAYIKKGHIKEWLGNEAFRNKYFTINNVVFSSSNGVKTDIKLAYK